MTIAVPLLGLHICLAKTKPFIVFSRQPLTLARFINLIFVSSGTEFELKNTSIMWLPDTWQARLTMCSTSILAKLSDIVAGFLNRNKV